MIASILHFMHTYTTSHIDVKNLPIHVGVQHSPGKVIIDNTHIYSSTDASSSSTFYSFVTNWRKFAATKLTLFMLRNILNKIN